MFLSVCLGELDRPLSFREAWRWVRTDCGGDLVSAGVREFRKRGMGKEMGWHAARKCCLTIWYFSGRPKVRFYLWVSCKSCGHMATKLCSLRTENMRMWYTGRPLYSGKDCWGGGSSPPRIDHVSGFILSVFLPASACPQSNWTLQLRGVSPMCAWMLAIVHIQYSRNRGAGVRYRNGFI